MDQNSMSEWLAQLEPLLRKWTGRYAGGALHEEALQIARITCWRKAATYDPARGASLTTYLFRAVQGELSNWYSRGEGRWRDRHLFPPPLNEEMEPWENSLVDTTACPLDEGLIWKDWMEHLTEQEALCMTLHLRDGYPLSIVARLMNVPYERVKKWKQRACSRLRRLYLEQYKKEFVF